MYIINGIKNELWMLNENKEKDFVLLESTEKDRNVWKMYAKELERYMFGDNGCSAEDVKREYDEDGHTIVSFGRKGAESVSVYTMDKY